MATKKGQGGEPEADKQNATRDQREQSQEPDPSELAELREEKQRDRAVEQKRDLEENPPKEEDTRQQADPSATMNRVQPGDGSADAAERERAVREPAVPGQPPGAVYPDRAG